MLNTVNRVVQQAITDNRKLELVVFDNGWYLVVEPQQ